MPLPAIAVGVGAKLLGVRKFLSRIPTWVWIVVAALILAGLGAWWHGNKVKAFGDERYAAGRASRDAEMAALQRQLNSRNAELAAAHRRNHDAQIRRNAADADALRVRGPGKAACPGASFLPAAAGGRDGPGRAADDAVADVHREQWQPLVGLPFAPTVDFAEQHDNFRTEALSWRAWHAAFTAEWEAYRAKAEAAAGR